MKQLIYAILFGASFGCSGDHKTKSATSDNTAPIGQALNPETRDILIQNTLWNLERWSLAMALEDSSSSVGMDLISQPFNYGNTKNDLPIQHVKMGEYTGGAGWITAAFVGAINLMSFPDYDPNSNDVTLLAQVVKYQSGLSLTQVGSHPFQYINPDAVKWAYANFYLKPKSRLAGQQLQKVYEVTFRRFVRTLALSHVAAMSDFKVNAKWYNAEIIDGGTDASSAFIAHFKLPAEQTEIVNADYFPMAAGFWVRRGMDGTEALLWEYTRQVIMDYDSDWACRLKLCG